MKWAGVITVLTAIGIAGASLGLFAAERQGGRAGLAGVDDLAQLDRDFAARIGEMVKTMENVKRRIDKQIAPPPVQREEILGNAQGRPQPVAPPPVEIAPAPRPVAPEVAAPPPPPPPPWWQGYRVTLISTGNARYAVVNNRLMREGELLGEGITLERIESGAIWLRHGEESQRIALSGR